MNPWIKEELFHFLLDLERNNNREWFHSHKERFENDFREPLLKFVNDFQEPLKKVSNRYVADPRKQGGSLFRIYRDVRFSKNKEPYKTHGGIHFRHEKAKDVHAPGFYLHLQPGECFFGAGIWHPAGEELKAIRRYMDQNQEEWLAVKKSLKKRGFEMVGDRLKRPPRDYSSENPIIEDLKFKDFIVDRELSMDQVMAQDFMDQFQKMCKDALPLMDFLCKALGV